MNADFIQTLRTGDEFEFPSVCGNRQKFRIVSVNIVHCDFLLENPVDLSQLIFVAPYPFHNIDGNTPLRYVVYASNAAKTASAASDSSRLW